MLGEPKQASSATMAISFITVGALMVVWTTVYYLYLQRSGSAGNATYWCAGMFLSGLVLIGVGVLVGQIGRSARGAEVTSAPPVVSPPAVAVPQADGAAVAVPTPTAAVVPGNPPPTAQPLPGELA